MCYVTVETERVQVYCGVVSLGSARAEDGI